MQLGRAQKTTRNAELRFLREGNERAPQALRVVGFRSYADINDAPEHTNAYRHVGGINNSTHCYRRTAPNEDCREAFLSFFLSPSSI